MLALEDIRVLDLTHLVPGQFCTMMLADMGAEVLSVVRPPRKSSPRKEGYVIESKWQQELEGGSIVFGRNKRSIFLNLKNEKARRVFCRIAERMDVAVEGFRPGVVQRLGIDYPTLKTINPRLIYCAMSGFGQEGPYRDLPGHDITYVGIGGALSVFGDPPRTIPNLIGDFAGATLHAVIGILMALIAREKTGRGQYVDVSYTDGVVSLMTQFFAAYFTEGDTLGKGYRQVILNNPGYGVYQTRDGKYITLGCAEPWFWENLCRALGREDLVSQYFAWETPEEIRAYFAQVFLTKTREEWCEFLQGFGIPVGRVYGVDEVFSDPQVLHRQMLVEVEDRKGNKQYQVGIPIKLSDTPGRIRSTAPIPGQHTEQVLLELGYTKEDIEALCTEEAISLPNMVNDHY